MNVEQLLRDKGREVVSVQPHRTLAEAIRTLSEKRIGAVVVMGADGSLVGILSERDIIRALGELGGAALESAVSRSMTSSPRPESRRSSMISPAVLDSSDRPISRPAASALGMTLLAPD